MSFLVLLLAVLLASLGRWRRWIQRDGAYLRLLRLLDRSFMQRWSPWLLLALMIVPPLLLLGGLLAWLRPLAHGWLLLPVHLLVVLYGLGRVDIPGCLGAWRDACRRGDGEAMALIAERDLGLQADSPETLVAGVRRYLLWQAHQGFFAVIFWYALLGPLAVLGYRLLALLQSQAQAERLRAAAGQLLHALDWLPARLECLSFALVGNFVASMRCVLDELLRWPLPAVTLLERASTCAAELGEALPGPAENAALDELWHLLLRTALLWYALLALGQLL